MRKKKPPQGYAFAENKVTTTFTLIVLIFIISFSAVVIRNNSPKPVTPSEPPAEPEVLYDVQDSFFTQEQNSILEDYARSLEESAATSTPSTNT